LGCERTYHHIVEGDVDVNILDVGVDCKEGHVSHFVTMLEKFSITALTYKDDNRKRPTILSILTKKYSKRLPEIFATLTVVELGDNYNLFYECPTHFIRSSV